MPLTYNNKNSNAMNKVIQLLESTKQKQEESLKQLPKMVDGHVATVATEGEQFIKEIDQALLVLSNIVGKSEQLACPRCKSTNILNPDRDNDAQCIECAFIWVG